MKRLVLVLASALFIGACSTPGAEPVAPPTPEDSPMTSNSPTPSPSPSPSFELGSDRLSPEPANGGEELAGVLGADSIEGGCGYLETADRTRYEVIYPDGWQLLLSPLQLVAPDGDVVARGGDTVTVRGHAATDMLSICQIGPIFRATTVVSGG